MLKYISWAAFAVSGVFILMTFANDTFIFVPPAFSLFVSGVVFNALHRIVTAIEAIRNEIAPASEPSDVIDEAEIADRVRQQQLLAGIPARSLEELGADISQKQNNAKK